MGLFDKKFCDICGEKIGLLGNRKLSDGNLCKECANKLSPFFSERKQSTIEQIKEQLAYREENKQDVDAFNVTRMWGKSKYLFIDEEKGNFMVNWRKNYAEDNPDVIPLSSITRIDMDVVDSRRELMRKLPPDNKEVSYIPPRYETDYSVYFIINVKHDYFDEIKFEISDNISIQTVGTEKPNPTMDIQYREAMELGDEMKAALLNGAKEVVEKAKPKGVVICPHCGASTTPDANGRCEYCGLTIE